MPERETPAGAVAWRALRSYLFVPANRPDRFEKALASGADAIIVDLEDAVPPMDKAMARDTVSAFLSAPARAAPDVTRLVRINGLHTLDGLKDLTMLCALGEARADGLILPKTQYAEDICLVDDVLHDAGSDLAIGALIETCAGLENATAIALASKRLALMMFGGADMALDLRVALEWEPLVHARARIVHAAARAGIVALDMPWVDLADASGYHAELARSFALGFTARAAIHPSQIAAIHEALTPSDEAIRQAEALMQAWHGTSGSAAIWNGKLIEKPLVAQSQRILDLARRTGDAY